MTHVNNVNSFFKKNVYSNLVSLAIAPVSWIFKTEDADRTGIVTSPNYKKLILGGILAPILVPATIATSTTALGLALACAIVHFITFLVAKAMDHYHSKENNPAPPRVELTTTLYI